MDCIVHVVAKNWTGLSDFHFSTLGYIKISEKKSTQSYGRALNALLLNERSQFQKGTC